MSSFTKKIAVATSALLLAAPFALSAAQAQETPPAEPTTEPTSEPAPAPTPEPEQSPAPESEAE